MIRTKTKIIVSAAAVAGILISAFATYLILQWGAARGEVDADRRDDPFRFSRIAPQGEATNDLVRGEARGGLANFTSNIPIIVLRGEQPRRVSSSKVYNAFTMEVYEPRTNGPARLDNAPTVTTPVGLRLHGMVSRQFPKFSYRLKTRDATGATHGTSLLAMPSDADWVLQGPWLDKSLIRNAFSYDLARAMGCEAMRTRACELFVGTAGQPLADADYVGVYQLTEDIERGGHRVNLAKLAPDENSEPAITGGYLLAWDVGDGNYLPGWSSIQVKYPKDPSPAQMKWIADAFTRFDKALKGDDSRDPDHGYAGHIEVDHWVNYILFEELVFNLDAYTRSFYLQKDRGEKIRPGPVWDHDLGLGHEFPGRTSFDRWWFTQAGKHRWVTRLMEDPAFAAKMSRRWSELRRGVLSNEQIEARIDRFAAPLLAGAADRNFDRWKILSTRNPFQRSPYITIVTDNYPDQISVLKRFLRQRAAWMDSSLVGLR